MNYKKFAKKKEAIFNAIVKFAEKPKLHLGDLVGKKIKVRAGEPININIPMTGAPTPTVEWVINDHKMPQTNRILVSAFNSQFHF